MMSEAFSATMIVGTFVLQGAYGLGTIAPVSRFETKTFIPDKPVEHVHERSFHRPDRPGCRG
jgi:hypothetical protein